MALEGIRILDASDVIGHYAGRILADLGADVIKVEPVGGDPTRRWAPLLPDVAELESGLQFLLLNANKRGITIDVTQPRGRELYLALTKTADVLIDSLQEHEAVEFGLTADHLIEVKPDLIHTSITGWGLSGPRANWAYADIVGCAMSGTMQLVGLADGPPEQLPDMQGYHTASIQAAAGTMGAIVYRQSTGEGQRVEVSMQEAMSIAQETAMMQADILGTNRERGKPQFGLDLPGSGLYEAADGYVFLIASGLAGSGFPGLVRLMAETGDEEDLFEEPFRTFITDVMGTTQLRDILLDPGGTSSPSHRSSEISHLLPHMDDVVRKFCKKHPKSYLYEEGQKRRILVGIVNTPNDILESQQLKERNWFVDLEDTKRGVTLRYPGPQWQLQGTPAQLRRPAPMLGEHNNEVLSEIGIDESELSELVAEGVIAG
tara:strand:- start:3419 stop:4714 length:1296 start_codon:yes stop_codon:yes gene_type:complete